ncbi:uncharacterized protein Nmag_1823 [Natrialba magadii ATCC 43099]|uniref:Uncharacterized protein n=1 Tax=Natrialba magadii (strain ATCC 43099 / DSM 3394 / CCM 3739 / CIP 104546 / IAM 13178 / JCM 8861 / NBRC 102185 / NCIMB 2190 / MS3) TaxID=547559 RepID=D3SUY9_NATMM|nr:hypothetical protein [Natrialba magadii]ADD05397.1 uncharacterized protein Nmag_1823 [Natrialba magadii ATCC 43099]
MKNGKEKRPNKQPRIGRRDALKKVGAAGVIGSVSMIPLADITTADLGGDPEWTESYEDNSDVDSITHETKVGIGVSVEYYGSHVNNAGNWLHEFRMNSTHSGRRRLSGNDEWEKEGLDTRIRDHEFTVDINSSLSDPTIWTSDDPRNLGCTPPPSDPINNPDYKEAAETAVQAAVGSLHPVLSGGDIGCEYG